MNRDGKNSYYEVLDVSFNANPEVIRTAYIRAKNAYNRDSLATYSLFDPEESKRILQQIEEAYDILSDSDKRRKYDESHGIISSESVYDSYHKGNHAVAAFARSRMDLEGEPDGFGFEDDPFRRMQNKTLPASTQTSAPNSAGAAAPAATTLVNTSLPSHIERLSAMQNVGHNNNSSAAKSYTAQRNHEPNAEMEEKIQKLQNVNGAFLQSVRIYKKVTPEEIMDMLKISKTYLTALEADDVAKLPANVFVRGFVIQYAKALKLEHEKVAAAYMEYLRSKRPG